MDDVERETRMKVAGAVIAWLVRGGYHKEHDLDAEIINDIFTALDLPARDDRIRADALDEAVRVVAGFNDDSILLCRIGAAILALKEQTNG